MGKDKETLCELMQEAVSEQDAIEYAFENMSVDMQIINFYKRDRNSVM